MASKESSEVRKQNEDTRVMSGNVLLVSDSYLTETKELLQKEGDIESDGLYGVIAKAIDRHNGPDNLIIGVDQRPQYSEEFMKQLEKQLEKHCVFLFNPVILGGQTGEPQKKEYLVSGNIAIVPQNPSDLESATLKAYSVGEIKPISYKGKLTLVGNIVLPE